MSRLSSSLVIPDSQLAKEATDLLRGYSTDLLINHSIRVYLFAAEQGREQKLRFDPELLYVASAFHDFGLIKKFSSQNERFEVDGANAARQFLTAHNVPEEQVQTVWDAIALHTTPGVTQYMRPEIALLHSGVALDVLGQGFDQFPSQLRDEIVAKYPRKNFKESFLQAYFGAHVLRDAGGGVQGNGLPDSLYLLFRDVMCGKELTGGICAIDLEAFVFARELLDETEIVKCRGDVEEFSIEAELLLTALLSREQIDADGVVKKQIGGMLTQDVCGLLREHGIGNDEAGRESCHGLSSFFKIDRYRRLVAIAVQRRPVQRRRS